LRLVREMGTNITLHLQGRGNVDSKFLQYVGSQLPDYCEGHYWE
jgi:hypothetical protein